MKKIVSLLLIIFIVCLGTVPVAAASDEPTITLEIQSPNYPEYSVAIYTVKVTGNNLKATWYMEWNGKTYTISNVGGAMQDWEGFAGETYGAKKLDDNTFAFVFEGIGKELDGAYIWCVLEDGHYDVTSKKARITVGGEGTPPEILSIPTMLTVEQGDEAEVRCVAKSVSDAQLSFLWYETDSGRLEDIRAVNRGEETNDFMLCDTTVLGTRNYLCMVKSTDGGVIYSSVVPVTVIERQAVENGPSVPSDTTPPVTDTTGNSQNIDNTDKSGDQAFPWWGYALIALCSIAVGIGGTVIFTKFKNKEN